MSRQRQNGVITGNAGIDAHLIDAMGGGLCEIHGKYFGHGKYGLRDCPFCDIDEHFKQSQQNDAPNSVSVTS